MFFALLASNLILAAAIAWFCLKLLKPAMTGLITKLIGQSAQPHWTRFAFFSFYFTALGSGMDVMTLYHYLHPSFRGDSVDPLTADSWAYELYQTCERTLFGLTACTASLFTIGIILVTLTRIFEIRKNGTTSD